MVGKYKFRFHLAIVTDKINTNHLLWSQSSITFSPFFYWVLHNSKSIYCAYSLQLHFLAKSNSPAVWEQLCYLARTSKHEHQWDAAASLCTPARDGANFWQISFLPRHHWAAHPLLESTGSCQPTVQPAVVELKGSFPLSNTWKNTWKHFQKHRDWKGQSASSCRRQFQKSLASAPCSSSSATLLQ